MWKFADDTTVSEIVPKFGLRLMVMQSAKILGVTVRNDLKWKDHVDNITAKASRRIYLLSNLSRLA